MGTTGRRPSRDNSGEEGDGWGEGGRSLWGLISPSDNHHYSRSTDDDDDDNDDDDATADLGFPAYIPVWNAWFAALWCIGR